MPSATDSGSGFDFSMLGSALTGLAAFLTVAWTVYKSRSDRQRADRQDDTRSNHSMVVDTFDAWNRIAQQYEEELKRRDEREGIYAKREAELLLEVSNLREEVARLRAVVVSSGLDASHVNETPRGASGNEPFFG